MTKTYKNLLLFIIMTFMVLNQPMVYASTSKEATEIQKLQEKTFNEADIKTYRLDIDLLMDDEGVLKVKEVWNLENSATTFFSRKFVYLLGGVIENLRVYDETGKEMVIEFGFLDESEEALTQKQKDESARKEDNKAGYSEKVSGDAEIRIGMATAGPKTFRIEYDLKHAIKSDINGKQFIFFNILDANQVGLPASDKDLNIKWRGNNLPKDFSVIGFYNKVYVGAYDEPQFTGYTVSRVSLDYDKMLNALTKTAGSQIILQKENWLGNILKFIIVILTVTFVIFIVNILNRNQRTDSEDVPIAVTNKYVEKSQGKDRGGKGLSVEQVLEKIYRDKNWECIISALYTLRTTRVNEKKLVETWMAQLHQRGLIEITTIKGVDSLCFPPDVPPLQDKMSDILLKGMQNLKTLEISVIDLMDDQIVKQKELKNYLREAIMYGADKLQELELIHKVAYRRRTGQIVYQPTMMYHEIFDYIEPIMEELSVKATLDKLREAGEDDENTLFSDSNQETELYILLGIADVVLKNKELTRGLDLKVLRRITSRII